MNGAIDQLVTFRVEERDVVEAMQATLWRRMFRGPGAVMLGIVILAWLVLATLTLHLGQSLRDVFLFAAAVPLLLALLQYGFVPVLARRHFRQSKALQAPVRFRVEGGVIHLEGERGNFAMPMDELWRWGETRRLVMLFHSEMLYNIVPKQVLGESGTQALIAALEAAGVKEA